MTSAIEKLAALKSRSLELQAAARSHSRNIHEGDTAMRGPYDTEINQIAKQIAKLSTEAFFEEWTAEETAARRAAWNAKITARGNTRAAAVNLEGELGFTVYDLKRAVAHHAA